MTNTHRPHFIAAVMLLRDALGRFIRLRELAPARSQGHNPHPRRVRSMSIQLVPI